MTLTPYRSFLRLLSLGLLLVPVTTAPAQNGNEIHPDEQVEGDWVNDVPCSKESQGLGFIKGHEFRLCFKFSANELQPKPGGGTSWPTLRFESYTKRTSPNLTGVDLKVDHVEDHPGLIIDKVEPIGPERNFGRLSSIQEFVTKIGVRSEAQSDDYPLTLSITSGTETGDRKIEFRLPLLVPDKRPIAVQRSTRTEIDCWAGSKCSDLQLHFQNSLPYKLTITNVTINSDDLLEPKPAFIEANSLDANSENDITIGLKAKPMTFTRVFSGFGKPQMTIKIDYKDDYDRVLHSQAEMGFQIRPNILVLAIFLVLGAVVGTLVRIDLGRLQKAGVISRRERFVFAGTTFASGILVCLIALFANIKLVVLNDQNSYSAWDPKVLFFTALIATVSGLPILYAYLKVPRPADANVGGEQQMALAKDLKPPGQP
ncbi:MAG: hypothetical protein H0U60_06235 [Blastocatellia bacterium]|nr:hypothetical protein [Blastocatellia bacterium]